MEMFLAHLAMVQPIYTCVCVCVCVCLALALSLSLSAYVV